MPTDCVLWTGTINGNGYGQVSVGPRRSARIIAAHRLAYERAHGPIPAGMQVCHRCDVRACVNVEHLFLGTAAENQHDKRLKGRAAKGERNRGGGKLTDTDIPEIRRALARGDSKVSIGRRFGVSSTEIGYIAQGRHWSHVA